MLMLATTFAMARARLLPVRPVLSARNGKLKKGPVADAAGAVTGYQCPDKEIQIVKCTKAEADVVIAANHYSKKPTKNSFLSLLVHYRGEVHGALQLGYGIRPKIKGEFAPEEMREFDRMWLSDDMPKFSESIVLSMLHKYLQIAHPEIKVLISYSDTSVGNNGTIYRAANYILIDDIKADFYILPSGERVHPVSMWHRHKTRAWKTMQELYPGIRKANGRQLKFAYYFDRKRASKIKPHVLRATNA